MPRIIQFNVDYDSDTCWGLDDDVQQGVLTGYVTLRMRGIRIIEYCPLGMNNSIVTLLRSCFREHTATTEETSLKKKWPMFFCDGDLWNKCGIVRDFSAKHIGGNIIFSQFYGCECSSETIIEVPQRSWAISVIEQSRIVLRRSPKMKKGISKRNMNRYTTLRDELKQRLKILTKNIHDH